MKKILLSTLALAVSFALPNAHAATALDLIEDGTNSASDENREYLIDRTDTTSTDYVVGQLDVGDSLRGAVNFNTINSVGANLGGITGNDELTGVYQLIVTSKIDAGAGTFIYTFSPDPAFEANICGGVSECSNTFTPGDGAIIVMYSDDQNDFAGDFDDPTAVTLPANDDGTTSHTVPPSNEDVSVGGYATEEAFITTATDGDHFWTLGFTGDDVGGITQPDLLAGEGFNTVTVAAIGDNVLNAFLFSTGASGGLLNGGLSLLSNDSDGSLAGGINVTQTTAGIFGVNLVQFAFSGNLRGVNDLDTPFEISSNIDAAWNVERIPEPSILALLGMSFLGLCLSARRRLRS